MGFFRNFIPDENMQFKIGHRLHEGYRSIGRVIETRDNLNICKVVFNDINGKEKKIWFHLFTGNAVTLPKKGQKWAEDVPSNSEKAYFITGEPIYLYEIDKTANIFYHDEQILAKQIEKAEAEANESNKNDSVKKLV